jgi:ADP-sugar diphosphatase
LYLLTVEGKDDIPDEEFLPVVIQHKPSVGEYELAELPAGMIDGLGNFTGVAAAEVKEELGIEVNEDELEDMTEKVYGSKKGFVYPSPGGSDETMRIFLARKKVTMEYINSLQGRLMGDLKSGEKITVRIIKLVDLIISTRDMKALSAYTLYKHMYPRS